MRENGVPSKQHIKTNATWWPKESLNDSRSTILPSTKTIFDGPRISPARIIVFHLFAWHRVKCFVSAPSPTGFASRDCRAGLWRRSCPCKCTRAGSSPSASRYGQSSSLTRARQAPRSRPSPSTTCSWRRPWRRRLRRRRKRLPGSRRLAPMAACVTEGRMKTR